MTQVVVTGSEGFVAHHTIPVLEQAGMEVIRLDKVLGTDVCDPAAVRETLPRGCKVLHLAAVARFAEADADPAEAYRTNVGGVANLLRAAEEAEVERVVLASTASVYMPVWTVPIAEHHPTQGNSHYGCSKALGERMVGFSRVPFVVLRYAHLYGTHKWHGGLIDNFIARIDRGLAPVMYGGWQSNDFTYVKDVAEANLLALTTEHVNEHYNIGTGEEVTTAEAVDILSELTGYTGEIERTRIRVVDAPRFVLETSKATRLLGFKPEWSFRAGLEDMLSCS